MDRDFFPSAARSWIQNGDSFGVKNREVVDSADRKWNFDTVETGQFVGDEFCSTTILPQVLTKPRQTNRRDRLGLP
ncbi:MAG: hypothetical protein CMJ62_10535 [Planctomycetaceae bacterium]|nr:hypothetical protein [Planctomycetaceae bacterium]